MKDIVDPQQVVDAGELRDVLATWADAEELVNIGAYRPGSNPGIDRALQLIEPVRAFLRQRVGEVAVGQESLLALAELALAARESVAAAQGGEQ